MNKKDAINLLGGSVTAAAREIGVSPNAVSKWPEKLSNAISDRVEAVLYRRIMGMQPPTRNGVKKARP